MKSSLDKIFYKIAYHHIIYMCDFFMNLYNFFVVVCTGFHEVVVCTRYVPFHQTPFNRFPLSIYSSWIVVFKHRKNRTPNINHLIILPFGVFSLFSLFFFMYLGCDMPLMPLCTWVSF